MHIILSLLIGLNAHALTEAERDLIAAHQCFAEMDRFSVPGRKIVPSSGSNIRQIARTSKKTDDEHWNVNDYALWNSRTKNLHYISIKRNIEPDSPAYVVKHLSTNKAVSQNSDKIVLAAGEDGYSCPIHVDLKKGIQNKEAKLYQVAVAYEDCSDVHQAVEIESGLEEVTEEIVGVFESAVSRRLAKLTPEVLTKLSKKPGQGARLAKAYKKAKLDIYKKCINVQASNVQKSLRKFVASVKSAFPKGRLPAAK